MRDSTHTRVAATLAEAMRPAVVGGSQGDMSYAAIIRSLSGLDAPTLERMRGEVVSLMEAGLAEQAAERAQLFIRPKFASVGHAQAAYDAAMAGRAA